jgi:DNA-directed RNA polymerase specialized sigma24 family protein
MRYQLGTSVEMSALRRLGLPWGPSTEAERLLVGQLWRDAVEHNDLYDAFQQLTFLQQSIVRMYVVFGLEEDVIGEHLGFGTDSVRTEICKALCHLAEHASWKPVVTDR